MHNNYRKPIRQVAGAILASCLCLVIIFSIAAAASPPSSIYRIACEHGMLEFDGYRDLERREAIEKSEKCSEHDIESIPLFLERITEWEQTSWSYFRDYVITFERYSAEKITAINDQQYPLFHCVFEQAIQVGEWIELTNELRDYCFMKQLISDWMVLSLPYFAAYQVRLGGFTAVSTVILTFAAFSAMIALWFGLSSAASHSKVINFYNPIEIIAFTLLALPLLVIATCVAGIGMAILTGSSGLYDAAIYVGALSALITFVMGGYMFYKALRQLHFNSSKFQKWHFNMVLVALIAALLTIRQGFVMQLYIYLLLTLSLGRLLQLRKHKSRKHNAIPPYKREM